MKVAKLPNTEIIKLPPAISIKKITEIFGITRYTVMQAVNSKKLTVHKPNQNSYIFITEDVIEWIKSC